MGTSLLHEEVKRLGGEEAPEGGTVEHYYAGSKHVQNTDGSTDYGSTWHRTPRAEASFRRRGVPRVLPARPCVHQRVETDGGSALPVAGSLLHASRRSSETRAFRRDRKRDVNQGRIGIFGSQLSYAGSSGRVTREPLGRDLNPRSQGYPKEDFVKAVHLSDKYQQYPLIITTPTEYSEIVADNEKSMFGIESSDCLCHMQAPKMLLKIKTAGVVHLTRVGLSCQGLHSVRGIFLGG